MIRKHIAINNDIPIKIEDIIKLCKNILTSFIIHIYYEQTIIKSIINDPMKAMAATAIQTGANTHTHGRSIYPNIFEPITKKANNIYSAGSAVIIS